MLCDSEKLTPASSQQQNSIIAAPATRVSEDDCGGWQAAKSMPLGPHLAGDQFEWVHPAKDLRVLGGRFVDTGSRAAILHIQCEGTISKRPGNITGDMAVETLRNWRARYFGVSRRLPFRP